jgi:hypothetical protein
MKYNQQQLFLASIFGNVNHRRLKWPPTIGIMALALPFSIVLAIPGKFIPAFLQKVVLIVARIDFQKVLMNFVLKCRSYTHLGRPERRLICCACFIPYINYAQG